MVTSWFAEMIASTILRATHFVAAAPVARVRTNNKHQTKINTKKDYNRQQELLEHVLHNSSRSFTWSVDYLSVAFCWCCCCCCVGDKVMMPTATRPTFFPWSTGYNDWYIVVVETLSNNVDTVTLDLFKFNQLQRKQKYRRISTTKDNGGITAITTTPVP